jgi:hypothetical protein
MLGKATAEFRKMTNDFRYALEDEVREMERQTRIREEEIATAARAAQTPVPMPAATPEGAIPRDTPEAAPSAPAEPQGEPQSQASLEPDTDSSAPQANPADTVSVPHEKSSDDNSAV